MRSDFSRRNDDLKRRLGVSTDESSEDEAPPGTKRRKTLDHHEEEEMELSSSEEEHRFRPPLPPGEGCARVAAARGRDHGDHLPLIFTSRLSRLTWYLIDLRNASSSHSSRPSPDDDAAANARVFLRLYAVVVFPRR